MNQYAQNIKIITAAFRLSTVLDGDITYVCFNLKTSDVNQVDSEAAPVKSNEKFTS